MPATLPDYWDEATAHLSDVCPVLRRLIRAYPDETLRSKRNLFQTLAHAIVGQQISVAAADAIWGRLKRRAAPRLTPARVAAIPSDDLRACGLSRRKVEYLHGLATAFSPGGPLHRRRLSHLSDDAIRDLLLPLRGIGPWTVNMALIFTLLRPDILPVLDIGLIRAMERHYNNGASLTRDEILNLAEPWTPYRTVATWYLWRDIDDEAVAY